MLGFFVSTQIDLTLEGSAANVASEWLESSVFPTVSDQVRTLAESLAAHSAFVRLLP